MDVYAHAALYAAIALPVLHVHLASLVLQLDAQLHAQYADATIVCVVLNVILSHANAVQYAQVILANAVQYANHILVNVVLYAIAVLVYVVANAAHVAAVQAVAHVYAIILVVNKVRQAIVHLLIIAFEIEFKYFIFFLELHIM